MSVPEPDVPNLPEDLTPEHDPEPKLLTREQPVGAAPTAVSPKRRRSRPRLLFKLFLIAVCLIGLAVGGAFFGARRWVRQATASALPQIDGTLSIPGLTAAVTVQRDGHGVPHIKAANLDDLVIAQGYVTTQDRLWQMDMMRRHAAGELAAVLGPTLLAHDRLQRTLQIRAAADRAIAVLPADQLHWLQMYARGVNASMDDQQAHLPLEFRMLRYKPAPWTPRDTLLVSLAMIEDLTNAFPDKLAREALMARLPPERAVQLAADLYPVGSWRDHPPAAGLVDLTIEGPEIEQVPLDESQTVFAATSSPEEPTVGELRRLAAGLGTPCAGCTAGSNAWAVSGARTASGKPLLSNDMHLNLMMPGAWYEASLEAPKDSGEPFQVAGVTLPGTPFVIVGHNRHIAWGFTSLGADVQDVYIEQTRGTGASAEFLATGKNGEPGWQPIVHHAEVIEVHGEPSVTLNVTATRHGDTETPILTPVLPEIPGRSGKKEGRTLALRWTVYDPAYVTSPFFAINDAHDWPSFCAALANFHGPSQNTVYADDHGHIGFHTTGMVPLRGPRQAGPVQIPANLAAPNPPPSSNETPVIEAVPNPLGATGIQAPVAKAPMIGGPLSPVPVRATPQNEWTGYIPFDELPQVFDPPSGILATANARVTPNDYPYPLTLDWAAPYRNERLWHRLAAHDHFTAGDMLAMQSDVYSEFDHVLAQRLAYAIDQSKALAARPAAEQKGLRQAADLLRSWNGRMEADAAAPAIVFAAHTALWRILLQGQIGGKGTPRELKELDELYAWGERTYALEQIVMHAPPRWLPAPFQSWDDLLASAVDKGLADAHAPHDLATWKYGSMHTVEVEHPIFSKFPQLGRIFHLKTGTGSLPLAGDRTTIRQVGRTFGPSERLTVDFGNLDASTLNIVLGQSGNVGSPWLLDQFSSWYRGSTFALPFTEAAVNSATTHTLTLQPR